MPRSVEPKEPDVDLGDRPTEVGGGAPRRHPPEVIEELGIDIIKVDRIRAALDKFGERFSKRVLTPSEQRYVRGRPETFAGRWAAKEAVSKVLGLRVRGVGRGGSAGGRGR